MGKSHRGIGTSLMIVCALVGASPFPSPAHAAEPETFAVARFDYKDTSGEPQDQTAEHEARVAAFGTRIRENLTGEGVYGLVELDCLGTDECSLETLGGKKLLAAAQRAEADYLVFGSIQKMSTLVGWGRVDVLDVAKDRILFDRVISFRGDNDAAFERAADFVSKDIVRTLAEPEEGAQAAERGIR